MRLRQGRRVARHLYLQEGDEPSDSDRPVGTVDSAALAAFIVGWTDYAINLRQQETHFDHHVAGPLLRQERL